MTMQTFDEPSIPPSTLGRRLRDAREWREMDQAALAEALDVRRSTISNYERGVTVPSKLQVNAWAVTCQVDVDWLKTGQISVTAHDGPDDTPTSKSGKNRFGKLQRVVTGVNFGSHADVRDLIAA